MIVSHESHPDGSPAGGRAFGPGFTIAWSDPADADSGASPRSVIEAAADRLAHLDEALGSDPDRDTVLAHLDAALALLR